MALSHLDTSEVFPENGSGRAVLISDGVTVEVLVVWVYMGMAGFAGGIWVTGLVTGGLYAGSEEPEGKGVVA